MSYLYSFLRDRCALDVGAHIGEVSEMLLDAGFEVHAFEPYPPVFDRLNERLGHRRAFQAHPWALGEADRTGTLHIVSDTSGRQLYRDSTLYSSLLQHAMPSDLVFTDSLEVAVKRLDTLHSAAIIPERVGLVKIDAEGFDLHVVQGMGPHRYPVVVSEVSGLTNALWRGERDLFPRGYGQRDEIPAILLAYRLLSHLGTRRDPFLL